MWATRNLHSPTGVLGIFIDNPAACQFEENSHIGHQELYLNNTWIFSELIRGNRTEANEFGLSYSPACYDLDENDVATREQATECLTWCNEKLGSYYDRQLCALVQNIPISNACFKASCAVSFSALNGSVKWIMLLLFIFISASLGLLRSRYGDIEQVWHKFETSNEQATLFFGLVTTTKGRATKLNLLTKANTCFLNGATDLLAVMGLLAKGQVYFASSMVVVICCGAQFQNHEEGPFAYRLKDQPIWMRTVFKLDPFMSFMVSEWRNSWVVGFPPPGLVAALYGDSLRSQAAAMILIYALMSPSELGTCASLLLSLVFSLLTIAGSKDLAAICDRFNDGIGLCNFDQRCSANLTLWHEVFNISAFLALNGGTTLLAFSLVNAGYLLLGLAIYAAISAYIRPIAAALQLHAFDQLRPGDSDSFDQLRLLSAAVVWALIAALAFLDAAPRPLPWGLDFQGALAHSVPTLLVWLCAGGLVASIASNAIIALLKDADAREQPLLQDTFAPLLQ